MHNQKIGKVIIPSNTHPWPHERRVAELLSRYGYIIEFLPVNTIGSADILLDGIRFEIKSPRSRKTNTIEHRIKDAVRNQSSNIIIDSSRIRNMPDIVLQQWLTERCRIQPQIKRLLFVNKKGQIIDIK